MYNTDSRANTHTVKRHYPNLRRRQEIFRKIVLFICAIIVTFGIALGAYKSFTNAEEINDVHYYKYYTSITVEAGDTLSSLACEYGNHFDSKNDFINEVIYSNHLTDDSLICGQSLIVPYYSDILM